MKIQYKIYYAKKCRYHRNTCSLLIEYDSNVFQPGLSRQLTND